MILALDSSTSRSSVALVRDGMVVRELTVETPRARGAALFSALQDILGEAEDLSRVVVGTGPGSYNGIRSVLAAGWGIATARKVPLVGVSSLRALADGSYCAVGDARRGQVYFAVVDGGEFVKEPVLLEAGELDAALEPYRGLTVFVPGELAMLPAADIRTPSAVRLALIGMECEPAGMMPEPIYLKPAYINTARKA